MPQSINVTYAELLEHANREIVTLRVSEAIALHGNDGYVFVDIRDQAELDQDGRIPGAVHAPRGMLEFLVCPTSPFHQDIFAQGKSYILYCAGGWRSALAAQQLQAMGLISISHLGGGLEAWLAEGGPVEWEEP